MAPPKKLSIFAQRMKAQRLEKMDDTPVAAEETSDTCNEPSSSNFGDRSFIVNSLDANAIHNENIEKLKDLSIVEIKEEQKRLLKELDPALVQFLRAKREKALLQSVEPPMVENSSHNSISEEETKLSRVPELANKYVHMDVVEEEKLKWLEDLPPLPPIPPDAPYTARFDFNGVLLPYTDGTDKTLNAGLHHHGEDAQRPGYTLQELLHLSRSAVTQQRILAISSLASILERAEEYDGCFDIPLRVQLMNPELFLLIRFSLDDKIKSTVMTSLRALCNLLVCHLDELCFDRELGTFSDVCQPLMFIAVEDLHKEEKEIKDVDILKLDIIKGALRTDLLLRLRYILDELRPEPMEIVYVIKCLIRIVRHSYESTLLLIKCPGLLETVQKILLLQPGPHTIETLKFFRLIASHGNGLAYHLHEQKVLIEMALKFIAAEHEGNKQSSVLLICECFHFWDTFIRYGIALNKISEFSFVIHKLLIFHLNSTSITSNELDISHCCSLFVMLESAAAVNYHSVEEFVPTSVECCRKWLTQLTSSCEVDWFFCKLCGLVLRFLAVFTKNSSVKKYYRRKFAQANPQSKNQSTRTKSSLELVVVERFNEEVSDNILVLGIVPPTLRKQSVLPLFSGIVQFFLHNPYEWSEAFLRNESIQRYFSEITQDTSIHSRSSCIYARHEMLFLVDCCKLFAMSPVAEFTKIYHELSLVLILCIQTDDKASLSDLFKLIVFNQLFFTNVNAQIDMHTNQILLEDGLQKLNSISECYLQLLNLTSCPVNKSCRSSLFSSEKGLEPALPTDWQFYPIMQLHNSQITENLSGVLEVALYWIYILECLRPVIASRTSVTARFCRLCCVFLIENDLFRDFPLLLNAILMKFLQYNDSLDFEKPISGLTSFYDFYRELLEQLNGVSYNDESFSNFIVVPLQQRHSDRFRKLVWSEQSPTIRFLGTPLDKYLLPLQNYLEPVETDESLLTTYLYFLATNKVRMSWSPLLYNVALHHVAMFIKLHPDLTCAKILLGRINALGNKELQSNLLNYQYEISESM
ncbi:LOW QUALITY PROTEIN: RNA polymerase II-associated protein 1 [Bemisia tabaci]|uniref:LOW QUALITY PROTEIN: RNA polymerase II-associated protein 1 n=1 Tax=Bemisia tabaci TaxID=7038 RepID=UPI003B2823A4